MATTVLKEITPLIQSDCFTIALRDKSHFNFPLHFHEEFELNLIYNAKGAKRIVGDSVELINNYELVLIGPGLIHGWFDAECKNENIKEITVQFHKDLFDDKLLQRNQLSLIRNMLSLASQGILFDINTGKKISQRLEQINNQKGFASVIELMYILHELSIAENARLLSNNFFSKTSAKVNNTNHRIDIALEYMNKNFERDITLSEVAKETNMAETSFSRFFKNTTGTTFSEHLIDVRIGHVTRMLIDTQKSIAEIAYHCGFNNISNFNRIFKHKKSCTPKEFREGYSSMNRLFF